jgi:hypothetical protein
MSRHLNQHLNQDQQRNWQDALAAVEETAANTDHESSTKQPLLTLVEQVRSEPEAVLRQVALIRLEPMGPTTSQAMLAAVGDGPHGSRASHV